MNVSGPALSHSARLLRRARNVFGVCVPVVALLAAFAVSAPRLSAQKSEKPLSKKDVIELLEGDVPSPRVAEVARTHGITFEMTGATERELRDAGADDDLIKTLRELAPKPAAEPSSPSPGSTGSASAVLVIQATPGGAQVYIDDEPKATTSSEGRVRFSQLSPGEHTVRLSLAGHREFEQKVELKPGQTATVYATLEAAANPSPLPKGVAEQGQSQPSTSPQEQAGIGLFVAPYEGPNGEKSAYVSGVAPNGPAERAGLRVGCVVLNIDGQAVTSPDDLKAAIGAHRPGDTVRVTYSASPSTGGSVTTASVQLASLATVTQSASNVAAFLVAHDHGLPAGQNLCVGWMTISNGMVHFHGQRALTNGILGGPTHSFDIRVVDIREAKKNGVYLANFGGFHIRLLKGTNSNFFVVNAQGNPQPPDPLLSAIDDAMSKSSKPASF